MTIAESLSTGLETTVIGLATVFAVLIILMGIIQIMKAIFYKEPSNQKKDTAEAAPIEVKEEVAEIADDDELIAVLTAAVAASLNTSTYNLQIKSYRRINNNTSAWNRAGVRETINNRF